MKNEKYQVVKLKPKEAIKFKAELNSAAQKGISGNRPVRERKNFSVKPTCVAVNHATGFSDFQKDKERRRSTKFKSQMIHVKKQ